MRVETEDEEKVGTKGKPWELKNLSKFFHQQMKGDEKPWQLKNLSQFFSPKVFAHCQSLPTLDCLPTQVEDIWRKSGSPIPQLFEAQHAHPSGNYNEYEDLYDRIYEKCSYTWLNTCFRGPEVGKDDPYLRIPPTGPFARWRNFDRLYKLDEACANRRDVSGTSTSLWVILRKDEGFQVPEILKPSHRDGVLSVFWSLRGNFRDIHHGLSFTAAAPHHF